MTAVELERLLAEEWPTGLFGGPRPADPAPSPAPCHDEAVAQHYADLETAISRTHRKATT